MNASQPKPEQPIGVGVRADFVPVEAYISPEFLRLEAERLWTRVWQVACREEELPHVGSFVTYNIMDESIVVVRVSATELKAFYNACQHRGRRLTEGCGHIYRFHCRFHGWQYGLDGAISRVLDREDWDGCDDFSDADLSLKPVRVGTWGGWVFVNPDPNAKSLESFLEPVAQRLDPYELERMRYRWYASVKVPCNWKVALEAFNEAYHVSATHPQLMTTYGDDRITGKTFGPHSVYWLANNPDFPIGSATPRLNKPAPEDLRRSIVDYYDLYNVTLRAIFSERDVEATRRLLTEVPAGASAEEIMTALLRFQREAAIAAGAGYPDISFEQMVEAGNNWHVFPNLVMLQGPTGLLAYRSLPHPSDPNYCYFEVYSLLRYAEGAEPPLERKYLHDDDDWKNFKEFSVILQQDFDNMGEVQKGMKSRGFKGARTNPKQEMSVSNFHRTLWNIVGAAPAAEA
jgi:phenylpropionate dioxygenase-like ring-hydroxylating dioxygenase large terminal subunit